MLAINPGTARLLLSRYVDLKPGDWIAQTAANAAMGQYVIQLARRLGVRTLNVVRREAAAEQVRRSGGDRVVAQGEHLFRDAERALGGEPLRLVLDNVGGATVGELAKLLGHRGAIVGYGLQSGEFPSLAVGYGRTDLRTRRLSRGVQAVQRAAPRRQGPLPILNRFPRPRTNKDTQCLSSKH